MTPEFIEHCIAEARTQRSRCSKEALTLEGMSGAGVRHFLNNLVSMKGARYLEVGLWMGSTFLSAISNNKPLSAVGCDNWSQFGGPKEEFFTASSIPGLNLPVFSIHECDFRKLKLDQPANIYFYDGEHNQADQRDALTKMRDNLEDRFIYVVDDWVQVEVRTGTNEGIHNQYKILHRWEIDVQDNRSKTDHNGENKGFWRGLGVFILEKK